MTSPRDVLNRLRWEAPGARLDHVVVAYRHRGAPGDVAFLRGEEIESVGRSFLDLPEGVRLPMHRILRIEKDGKPVWERERHGRRPPSREAVGP